MNPVRKQATTHICRGLPHGYIRINGCRRLELGRHHGRTFLARIRHKGGQFFVLDPHIRQEALTLVFREEVQAFALKADYIGFLEHFSLLFGILEFLLIKLFLKVVVNLEKHFQFFKLRNCIVILPRVVHAKLVLGFVLLRILGIVTLDVFGVGKGIGQFVPARLLVLIAVFLTGNFLFLVQLLSGSLHFLVKDVPKLLLLHPFAIKVPLVVGWPSRWHDELLAHFAPCLEIQQ